MRKPHSLLRRNIDCATDLMSIYFSNALFEENVSCHTVSCYTFNILRNFVEHKLIKNNDVINKNISKTLHFSATVNFRKFKYYKNSHVELSTQSTRSNLFISSFFMSF